MDNNVVYDTRQSGLTAFYNRIYSIMGLGVLTSAAVAYIMIHFFYTNLISVLMMNQFVLFAIMIIPMFAVIPIQRAAMKNSPMSLPLFFAYAAFMGFILALILLAYTQAEVTLAFVTSAAMFFGLSIFGRVTKRDLSGIGKAAFAAVWGLIVASLLQFFIGGAILNLIIGYVGVVVFAVLIAWNNQMIERVYDSVNGQVAEGWAVSMALSLYISFLNLFLSLLRIFGGGRR